MHIEEPFDGDGNNIYYINGGRCSGIVDRTVNELVKYANNLQKQKYKEVIDKAKEYIENNPLYEEEYDYDYEENSYLSGIDDETAKKDLLKILRGEING